MDALERLYNELPYFDKQKFIGRHLADARQEDFDDFFSDEGLFLSNTHKNKLIDKAVKWLSTFCNSHDIKRYCDSQTCTQGAIIASFKDFMNK